MLTYQYRCKSCGHEFDRTTHADAVKCPQGDLGPPDKPGCTGWARRLWTTSLHTQNLKQERESR